MIFTPPLTSADQVADAHNRVRQALAKSKPAALVDIENRLSAARRERTALYDQQGVAINAAREPLAPKALKHEIARLDAALKVADGKIDALRRDRQIARDAYAPKRAACLAPILRELAGPLREAADLLAAARLVLRDVDDDAVRSGLPTTDLHRLIPDIGLLRGLAERLDR